jgi:hypothetical protein
VGYADITWGSFQVRMQRLIARFLLMLAAAGILLPPALQAATAPAHLCCRRTEQHRCHSYAVTNPGETTVHGPGCSQNCRRAVAVSNFADPERSSEAFLRQDAGINATIASFTAFDDPLRSSLCTRAPPQSLIC